LNDPFAIYQDGTDVGQCTWYAAGMRPDLDGIDTGNASRWLAQASGKRPEGATPVVGAIAVNTTADGGLGHVAYVVGVANGGATLILDEANVDNKGNVFLNVSTPASEFAGYIYGGPAGNGAPSTGTGSSTTTTTGGGSIGGTTTSQTFAETTGGPTNTWSNYAAAAGNEGSSIPAHDTVQVSCRVPGFTVADGNSWWYQIASSPWSSNYYASADAFYNNGETSGSLQSTPFFDPDVPSCNGLKTAPATLPTTTTSLPAATTSSSTTSVPTTTSSTTTSTPAPPAPTYYNETVGGVTHTWTDYSDAGGTEGPSIATGQTVQVACVVSGFRVSDGNTWWYQIASSPWSSSYYASADAFYNNGETSGSLHGTPFVDPAVPGC
jgi:hypothetical protein